MNNLCLHKQNLVYRICLCFFFMLAVNIVNAQNSSAPPSLINVGFKAPEVASLDKFGNIPVSYSTGVPSITIPIFQIKAGDISLPVSLDYHAGGIRVDEMSSSVGIGWALNAGGSVSRSMVGLPDEGSYLQSPPTSQAYDNQSTYYQYFYQCVKGQNETTPDIFTYSAGGKNGRFIIRKSDHTFIQFPLSNNKIEAQDSYSYNITDENGIRYIFDRLEYSTIGGADISTYISAWKLTKIISSSRKDTVYLQYETPASTIVQWSKSYSHTLGSSGNGALINNDNYRSVGNSTTESYLKEIIWKGGKISFSNVADRQDVQSGRRLSQINVYAKTNNDYCLLKSVRLTQSYFYYKPSGYSDTLDPSGENYYRLKLDNVTIVDANGTLPQVYSMTYNTTPMAPRGSAGQDKWGFNNGHVENTTLMPYHKEAYLGDQASGYFEFGSANRDVDEANMKACSIQSITYPTGGKTVYDLEAHQYDATVTRTVNGGEGAIADGAFQSISTSSFVYTSDMKQLEYRYSISKFAGYSDVTDRPECTLTDQTTGTLVLRLTNPDPFKDYTSEKVAINTGAGPVFLTVGHTYVIKVNIFTRNPNVKARFDLLYTKNAITTGESVKGGGLRVKSITNYDNSGALINAKTYSYGGNGSGTLLTPPEYLEQTSESVYYSAFDLDCRQNTAAQPTYTFRANSVVPISQYSGSPIVYGFVTEFDDANGLKNNGKREFIYNVATDNNGIAGIPNSINPNLNNIQLGAELISNTWRNGYLTGERTYKSDAGDYKLIESKNHIYADERRSEEQMLRVKPRIFYERFDCAAGGQSASTLSRDVIIDSYMLPTCAIVLKSDTVKTYDNSGNVSVAVNTYQYNDATHLLPTRYESFDSKKASLVKLIKYPHDFAAPGNVYQTMVDRNMLAPVVSTQQISNGTQTSLININYKDWQNNGDLLLPQSADMQVAAGPLENRVSFNAYDSYGNILDQQKINGPPTSYVWGYNGQYPVAEVKGAKANEIYHTGFEDGLDFDPNLISLDGSRTHQGRYAGKIYNSQPYGTELTAHSKTWLQVDLAGKPRRFHYSCWVYSDGPSIDLFLFMKRPGEGGYYSDVNAVSTTTVGSWVLLEGDYWVPADMTQLNLRLDNNGGGNAWFDDLRLYPSDGAMSTYTYDPLVGMTSATDAKGQTTHYEYDSFQRLQRVLDHNRKVLKQMNYHYQNQ
jgi:YD repeat-containing protein